MTEEPKDFPRRAAYKAAEVCEIAHIQPYVLRSWESEFPRLGVVRAGTRIYRYTDLEQVLRIKQMLFDEGLTLAGARRRIEEEAGPQPELPLEQFITPDMRQRIGQVQKSLSDLLAMLGGRAAAARDEARASDGDGHPSRERTPAPAAPKKAPKTAARAHAKPGRAREHRRVGRA